MIRGNCVRIGGGGNGDKEFIERTIKSVKSNTLTSIGYWAFANCSSLEKASFPSATEMGEQSFFGCSSLTEISIPLIEVVAAYSFWGCESLASITLPSVTEIQQDAFYECKRLVSLYLPGATVPYIDAPFYGTPIGGDISVSGEIGKIYVPSSMYNDYINDDSWSYMADQIVAV